MVDITDTNLLNLVSSSESQGDYNAVWNIPVGSPSQPDFSNMTITQVQQYQRSRIASGEVSSAVGRYQFVQNTLQETYTKAGIDPDTTFFTPAVQDQLIIARLNQTRRYEEWRNGSLSDVAFQNNLAKEFSSVPVPHGQQGEHRYVNAGESYYAGDGINKSGYDTGAEFTNGLSQVATDTGARPPAGSAEAAAASAAAVPYENFYSDDMITELAESAATGNPEGLSSLDINYTQSLNQYLRDNPTATAAQLANLPISKAMENLPSNASPAELAKKAAYDKALDNAIDQVTDNQALAAEEALMSQPVLPSAANRRAAPSIASTVKPSPNWFTSVDLATYNWSFYLVRQSVFDSPTQLLTDSAVVNRGDAVVISKSGVESLYTIDNFMFNSILYGDDTKSNAQTSTIQFELKEPMGFTLLDAILTKASDYNFPTLKDARYVLKLEFKGRDPVTGASTTADGAHFFPVVPYQVTSETGPQGTSYIWTCLSIPSMAAAESVVRAGSVTATNASTLGDAIEQLQYKLNKSEFDAVNPPSTLSGAYGTAPPTEVFEPRREWEIRFADNLDFDLKGIQMKLANSSGRATNMDNVDAVDLTVANGTNLASYLDRFIPRLNDWKDYVITQQENTLTTPDIIISLSLVGEKYDSVDNVSNQSYVKVIVEIGIRKLHGVVAANNSDTDNLTRSDYQTRRFNAMPIVKKYEYMYTGKNTEVLNYSTQFNMLFTIATDPKLGANTRNSTQEQPGTNINPSGFLSNVLAETNYSNVLDTVPREINVSSGYTQQDNDGANNSNELAAMYARSYARRVADTQIIEVDVIGDPYLLGIPGATFSGQASETLSNITATSDVFVAFVSYFPSNDASNPFGKGKMDLYTSGIFELREVEHRFQQGQYTSKLKMYRDHKSSTYLLQDKLENL